MHLALNFHSRPRDHGRPPPEVRERGFRNSTAQSYGSHGVASPGVSVQVVNKISAANYEYAFVAKRGYPFADFVMKFWRLCFVNTQLHNGDVRLRVNMTEHRPCAVIESPSVVRWTSSGARSCRTLRARSGSPGAGYCTSKSLARESAEIVDGSRRGGDCDCRPGTYQCAEMQRIALGFGTCWPIVFHAQCRNCGKWRSSDCRVRRRSRA